MEADLKALVVNWMEADLKALFTVLEYTGSSLLMMRFNSTYSAPDSPTTAS